MVDAGDRSPRHHPSAVELRDLALLRLGVLPAGHLLGAAVARPADQPLVGSPTHHDPVGMPVHLRLPDDAAAIGSAAIEAARLVLIDEESTPVAVLESVRAGEPGRLVGVLTEARDSETAQAAYPRAVSAGVALERGADGLVVLGRPVLAADRDDLDALAEAVGPGGRVLIAVADRQLDAADVPISIMVEIGAELADGLTLRGIDAEVGVLPLAWRDPESDHALVARLATRLGAGHRLALGVGADPAAQDWAQVSRALRERRDSDLPVPGLAAPVLAALSRRWPPRHTRGVVVMFSGLSGSGKSTLARDLRDWLLAHGERTVSLFDGDVVRRMLSAGLGFDRDSRIMNVRRIGYVAAEVARHGGVAICAPIAPYAQTRAEVAAMVEAVGDFVLVHVNTPLAECERRDLKGLYAQARAGLIPEFTGISDPYEPPEHPALRVDTSQVTRAEALELVVTYLTDGGWVPRRTVPAPLHDSPTPDQGRPCS